MLNKIAIATPIGYGISATGAVAVILAVGLVTVGIIAVNNYNKCHPRIVQNNH